MKKNILLFLFAGFLIFPLQAKKLKDKEFPLKYKKWLEEEVAYIITPREREVFLQLESDKERELFIEAFWKQRDPTLGTPENELKAEHYRRIRYANKFFGRETYRPGWQTDRGKIYILLGKPLSIERFEGLHGLHPVQIWFYQGSPEYGLPPQFNIVFFKRNGIGDYVLYSPSQDGPQSLLSYGQSQIDAADVMAAYNKIWELEPSLATNSLTLIPGEQLLPGQISVASDILLSNVQELPQKRVSPNYAEALLKYKDRVEVEYTANYIESDSLIKIIEDEGIFFVHYSIEPKKLSVDTFKDKYYTNFVINGNIQDLEGRIIFQYEKRFPLEFNKSQIENIGHQSLALQDMLPLIGGEYRFSLLLKNTVAKEFTSFEKNISIPLSPKSLQILPLLLGYMSEKNSSPSKINPFQIGNNQIWAQPQKIFLSTEKLSVFFQILGLTEDLKKNGSLKFTFYKGQKEVASRIKNINDYPDKPNFLEEFDLEKLSPGTYEIKVTVLDGKEKEILSEKEDFQIALLTALPRPLFVSKSIPLSNKMIFFHMLGNQWLNKRKLNKAKYYLKKAYEQNQDEVRFALDLSRTLFLLKEFKQAKEILLGFFNDKNKNYTVLELLAKSCQSLAEFKKAIGYYKEYLSHFGTNLEILNAIGESYFSLGNFEAALHAWEQSLKMNPKQEKIKEKVRILREKNL